MPVMEFFDVPATATPGQLVRIGGLKLRIVSCPGPAAMLPFGRAPVCSPNRRLRWRHRARGRAP